MCNTSTSLKIEKRFKHFRTIFRLGWEIGNHVTQPQAVRHVTYHYAKGVVFITAWVWTNTVHLCSARVIAL